MAELLRADERRGGSESYLHLEDLDEPLETSLLFGLWPRRGRFPFLFARGADGRCQKLAQRGRLEVHAVPQYGAMLADAGSAADRFLRTASSPGHPAGYAAR